MVKIGNIELKNNIICGPMAGISNSAFCSINLEHGAGLIVKEMVSDRAICYDNKKTLKMLELYPSEHPCAIQLFGGSVDTMVKAAKVIDTQTNCEIIDINMGCPVQKVIKANAGSKLLTDPELAFEIVSNIVKNVKKPVTVKLRIGYDEQHINVIEMAKLMEKAGASAITIHARTRAQFYSGKADWNYIKLVKEAVNIPIFGNGDVLSPNDAKRMIEETKCDGVMISRGCIGNPWIFDNTKALLENKEYKEPTKEEKINMCLEHAKRLIEYTKSEEAAIKQMRGIVGYYIKGFDGAVKVRQALNNITSYTSLENVLKNIF